MYLSSSLSEKELLNDLMLSEKQLSSSYNDAIIDSSCPILRSIFSECLKTTQEIQYSIYESIDSRGWNEIELVNNREIEKITNKYSKMI